MTNTYLRAGWTGFALFAVLVVVTNGLEELVYSLVLVGIAALFLVLVRGRPARATLVIGGILGALITLQQVAFSASDVTESAWTTLAVDLVGLAAGVAILVGTVHTWRARSALVPATI